MFEQMIKPCAEPSWQHPCNYGAYLQICKACVGSHLNILGEGFRRTAYFRGRLPVFGANSAAIAISPFWHSRPFLILILIVILILFKKAVDNPIQKWDIQRMGQTLFCGISRQPGAGRKNSFALIADLPKEKHQKSASGPQSKNRRQFEPEFNQI